MATIAVGLSSEASSALSLAVIKIPASLVTRTEECKVRAVIDTDPDVSLDLLMANANVVTDRIAARASELKITVSSQTLELIETYLSAHFYALFDQQPHESATSRAEMKFQGKTAMGFDATLWGQMAREFDPTDVLKEKIFVSADWLGTPLGTS